MDFRKWEVVIVEWVNCLKLCKPVNCLKDLKDGLFLSCLLKLLTRNDASTLENITTIIQFLREQYPEFTFIYLDGLALQDLSKIDLLVILSLLLHYSCIIDKRDVLTSPLCHRLSQTTQVFIRSYLEVMKTNITKEELFRIINQCISKNSNAKSVPTFGLQAGDSFLLSQSPLQDLLHTPPSKSVRLQEKDKEINKLRHEIDVERFEKSDLQYELNVQKERNKKLSRQMTDKTTEIIKLRTEIADLENRTFEDYQDDESRELQRRLRGEIDSLEKYVAQLQEEQDNLYKERDTIKGRDKQENEAVKSEILDKNFALMQAKNVVTKIERRLKELEEEQAIILKTTAKFAYFLQENAITPYNDAYQGYLQYLIDREKSLGINSNYEMIKEFRRMLQCYNEEKKALQLALSQSSVGASSITADEIISCVENLYNLKYHGEKIHELFLTQKAARKDENKSETREYVHVTGPKKQKRKKKKNKNQRVSDTTDSEYATDGGQNSGNHNYNRKHYNKQNFVPSQHYNQREPYNQNYQQRSNLQQPHMYGNQQKPAPVQYLQIKQDPSGQFDLRFGQASQIQNAARQNFNYPPPLMQYHHQGQQNNQNFQHGAYPKTNNTGLPPNQHYNRNMQQNNQRYGQPRGRSVPRSHSPNPRYSLEPNNFHGQQNFNQNQWLNEGRMPSHEGWQNQGPNQRGKPCNQGSKGYGLNQEGRPHNQGPNNPFNQGTQNHFKQNWKPNQYQGQHGKSFNMPKLVNPVQFDSGCESGGYRSQGGGNRSGGNNRNNNRRHFLDNSSSSTSSDSSSDDGPYETCR